MYRPYEVLWQCPFTLDGLNKNIKRNSSRIIPLRNSKHVSCTHYVILSNIGKILHIRDRRLKINVFKWTKILSIQPDQSHSNVDHKVMLVKNLYYISILYKLYRIVNALLWATLVTFWRCLCPTPIGHLIYVASVRKFSTQAKLSYIIITQIF